MRHLNEASLRELVVAALEQTRQRVKRAEDRKWSSFRHYASGEDCGVEIESEWMATRERSGKAPHLPARED